MMQIMIVCAPLPALLASSAVDRRTTLNVHMMCPNNAGPDEPSRWRRRTANRRERTARLLDRIEASAPTPALDGDDIPTLRHPSIDWDAVDSDIDPTRGGKIRPGTPRGARKRTQAEAFVHVVSEIMKSNDNIAEGGTTIVDAGCGGGNLALPLAAFGGPPGPDVEVLGVDVNAFALARLDERAERARASSDRGNCARIRTLRADLADAAAISDAIPADRDVVVASLHGCGAASDYAMELAHSLQAPFVVCPCCTAKSLTRRDDGDDSDRDASSLGASVRRSGATGDITYPRSQWLGDALSPDLGFDEYALLARTADVGLGPQTPSKQREHRRRAKRIVELDRLAHSSERFGYETRLMRMRGHDPTAYGKGEVLLGARTGTTAADAICELWERAS